MANKMKIAKLAVSIPYQEKYCGIGSLIAEPEPPTVGVAVIVCYVQVLQV